MNSLKTLTLVAVMTAVAYGVYASLHKKPEAEPPVALPENWTTGPAVQMPGAEGSAPGGVALPAASSSLPQFLQGGPAGPNPLLAPSAAPQAGAAPQASTGPTGAPSVAMPAAPLTSTINPPLGSQVLPSGGPPLPTAPYGSDPTSASLPSEAATLAGPSPFPATPPAQAVYPSSGVGDAATSATAENSNSSNPLPASPSGEGYAVAGDQPAGFAAPASGQQSSSSLQFAKAFDAAQVQADLGQLAEAHLELSRWYDQPQLSPAEQKQLIDMLDRLAGTVIYSHKHHLLERPYEVQPGDTLDRVAQAHQVPWQLLAKINGLSDPGQLQPGQSLKVLRGPFNAVVDLQNYRLTLFLQGRYAGRFNLGVGRDQPVAAGEYEVRGINENPIYRGPDLTIQPGDPDNPYGRYWIELGDQVGIHGSSDPRSIGRSDGRGCISVSAEDIEHLHDILSVGSRVLIRR